MPRTDAVLFDRDGTLIADVPYNNDPARVTEMPLARAALARLRSAGIKTAVVSNQAGIALGHVNRRELAAVNARMRRLLGPVGPILYCPHASEDRCACRKPEPGLIVAAARALGTQPQHCVLIGDIGSDVEAARAAGARAILVPTEQTIASEIERAPVVKKNLGEAIDAILGGAV